MDAVAVSVALAPEKLAPPIAESLGLAVQAVEHALALMAHGAQPAFLFRYRAEKLEGLGIRDLEGIQARAAQAAAFEFRRHELREELQRRGVVSPSVLAHLAGAVVSTDLDDVRALLKKRKRGAAGKARAAKLGGLAELLWNHGSHGPFHETAAEHSPTADEAVAAPAEVEEAASDGSHTEVPEAAVPEAETSEAEVPEAEVLEAETSEAEVPAVDGPPNASGDVFDPSAAAATMTSDAFPSAEQAVAGALAICSDQITEHPPLRAQLRSLVGRTGKLHTRVVESKKDKAGRYVKFFDRVEPCKAIATSNVLAIGRAEREGLITVDIEVDEDAALSTIEAALGIDSQTPAGAQLLRAARDAWSHGLGRAARQGVRRRLKERADAQAIGDFVEALRPLLLAPPLGRKPVISFDPGHQSGCRIAVLGGGGELLADDTVFPLQPKLQVPQAIARISELAKLHGVAAIAVPSSAVGRELERLCRQWVREVDELRGVVVATIDADAAALYGSSRRAKQELPKAEPVLRRAIWAGRRLQDPLPALCKLDVRKLGLGPYQHEVDQEELRSALEQAIASCINEVGVDLATADVDVLARVAGMSQALAKAVVARREQAGPIRDRGSLLELPGFAGKAFEQAAGFLRIRDGDQPLDATAIHPERYGQVTQMARDLGVTVADLVGNAELVDRIDASKYLGTPGLSGEPLGEPTLRLVVAELRRPGADPRPEFCAVEFHPGLETFEDLAVGMELPGIVTHLAAFGAFVDVGIAIEALVHVSELSHGYVSNPLDAVHVGQRVQGRVIEISADRKRFSLSLRAMQPHPSPSKSGHDARPGKPRRKKDGGKRDGSRGDAPRARGDGGGNPRDRGNKPRSERVLGFRLDLSDLAELLDKS